MSTIFNGRRVVFAAALLTMASASAARADVRFHNLTDQPIHFSMNCDGSGADDWTVGPYGTKNLYCTNGSDSAEIVIRTDHGDRDEVVRATVWDGRGYDLGYDRDGDVNIWRS